MTPLTSHFTVEEFTRSETAVRRNILNVLPADLLPNARSTAEMMERIRSYLSEKAGRDVPINVSSGYRCLPLNRALGSSDTSDHVRAEACDFTAPVFGNPTQIAQALAPVIDFLKIGQLINEYPDRNGWVHVGLNVPAKRINRVITITSRGTAVGTLGS